MAELYIGLMSGTSLDGVDAVLADFSSSRPQVLAHCSSPFPAALKAEFLALNSAGDNEIHRAALAANALARLYASQVQAVCAQAAMPASAVCAVGAHGQTVRHRPQEFDGTGYTVQLNQPALLAELCAIPVVTDFRSRDVAAGGQGAPLVPPFHQAWFAQAGRSVAVLNIGGISNITLLPAHGPVRGYDCGPGNALMDAWCHTHTDQPFDDAGRWAASAPVHAGLLAQMLQEPYFALPPPKSTGRDLFNTPWLHAQLGRIDPPLEAASVQATLSELTAQACARSVLEVQGDTVHELIVCGGGALNLHLMARLQATLPNCHVCNSAERGLPPLQVEATAFAWLARQTLLGAPGNLANVTGAQGARVLGAIYPA